MKITNIILAALLGLAATGASAQALRSTYFLEGATYRHQLNPAFMGERNYFSIPVLGNFNVAAQGNIGLSDFIYKYNDPNGKYDLTTFLSSTVGRGEFLDKLNDKNRINMNLNLDILSFGFYKWGGFNTFGLGVRSHTKMNLPYELFDFMKSGMSSEAGSSYHLKDISMNTNNYVEIALGHSRQINEKLTVGAKLKVLLGLANANAQFDQMDITMKEDYWEIAANGSLDASLLNTELETKTTEYGEEISGVGDVKFGIPGFGLGIDLGGTYQVMDGLTVSASVLDLGFLSWSKNHRGTTRNDQPYRFDGFTDLTFDSSADPGSVDSQVDNITDELEKMAKFYNEGIKSRTTGLAATLNFAGEYKLPYYDKLSFGLLSSTRINRPYTWTEAMISANVAPLSWFEASVNYSVSNFGSSLGWVLNFHPKGFNFFIGTDHMITNVTPQFLPVNNLNANVSMGFNITFGMKPKSVLAK